MKNIIYLLVLIFIFSSCSSIRVATDFDSATDFSKYSSFAFSKSQIEKLEISDLDKKRILSAIENHMQSKGYAISNNPDLIISIDTKSREDIYIDRYNQFPYYTWYGPGFSTTYRPSSRIVGLLYIDVVDAKTGSLLWQGNGSGSLSSKNLTRDELIANFVTKLLESYPSKNL
tara:strand:+ start:223 stop:741 length:519 start_codon:yes stop_codon:yes gene_type:complete